MDKRLFYILFPCKFIQMRFWTNCSLLLLLTTVHAYAATAQTGPSPEERTPTKAAQLLGRSIGPLFVLQDTCRHGDSEKSALMKGMKSFEAKLSATLNADMMTQYRDGLSQGQTLMSNEFANASPQKRAELCKDFNAAFNNLVKQLGKEQ